MARYEIKDLGIIDYKEALGLQTRIFEDTIEKRLNKETDYSDHVLICEHPDVYTLGKHGDTENILNPETLNNMGIQCVRTDRGGDVTYHGYGQIVVYPIVDVERLGMGVKDYISALEESVIEFLEQYDIQGKIDPKAVGVWVGTQKICAIGVKVSRYVTMHGLALNVNSDLSYFNLINPCGFKGGQVCSIKSLKGGETDFGEAKIRLTKCLENHLWGRN